MKSKVRMFLLIASASAQLGAASLLAAPKAAAPAAVDKFAAVREALDRSSEGLRGGAESAKSSAESPFRALQGASFTPMMRQSVAAGDCPSGRTWACDLICTSIDPQTMLCVRWQSINCGCR